MKQPITALQKAFDEVVSCAAHMNYAALPMKQVAGDQPSPTLVSSLKRWT